MKRRFVILATLLAFAPVVAEDEEPTRLPRVKEHVEVRERLPEDVDVAAFSTVVDASTVARTGQDLADLLRQVPGARVRDYGGFSSYATLSLRASTTEQVTVLVDGIPQNRALGGPVDLSSIPATLVDEIHVFRGFGPASLGLGGVGGLVDVRTRAMGSSRGSRVDLLYGEFGIGRLSASHMQPTGAHGGFRVDVVTSRGDGDFIFLDTAATLFNPDDDTQRRRRNNDWAGTAIQLQQAWQPTGADDLRIVLRLNDRERGVPWVDNLPTNTATFDERSGQLNATWRRRGAGWVEDTRLVLSGFDEESRFSDLDADFGVASDRATEMRGGAFAGVLRSSSGPHRLTLRADARREQAEVSDRELAVRDRGGARRTLVALTAEEMITLGRWTVAPSVRLDVRRDDFIRGGDGTLPAPEARVNDDAWSGKLGFACRASAETTVRGSIGRFFRSPGLRELFGNSGPLRGNPSLRAERGYAAELGIAHGRERGRLAYRAELIGFGRLSDDMIHFRQQSQGVAVAVNLLDSEVYGLEASGSIDTRFGLDVDGSATWTTAIDRSGGPFDGNPLVFQPEWLGHLGLGWRRKGWSARWEVTYTGENPTDEFDTPELRLPSRTIHDATAGHEWLSGVSVSLDVRNVFDRLTVDVVRYPLPGRAILAHVGWSGGAMRR